jgi:hypothetical protein
MLTRSLRPLILGATVALCLGTGSAAMAATAPTGPGGSNAGSYGCQFGGGHDHSHGMKSEAKQILRTDCGCLWAGNGGQQKNSNSDPTMRGGNNCGCWVKDPVTLGRHHHGLVGNLGKKDAMLPKPGGSTCGCQGKDPVTLGSHHHGLVGTMGKKDAALPKPGGNNCICWSSDPGKGGTNNGYQGDPGKGGTNNGYQGDPGKGGKGYDPGGQGKGYDPGPGSNDPGNCGVGILR